MIRTRGFYQVTVFVLALGALSLITGIAKSAVGLNATTVALLYLMVVYPVSAFAGYACGLSIAIVSGLLVNYFFLPPYGVFYIASPEDCVSFGVYTATASLISYYTAMVRRGAEEAAAIKTDLARYSAFSDAIRSVRQEELTMELLASELRKAFELDYCAIYNYRDNVAVSSGAKPAGVLPDGPASPDQSISFLSTFIEADLSLRCLGLKDQGKTIGALLIRRVAMSPEVEEHIATLVSLVIKLQHGPTGSVGT